MRADQKIPRSICQRKEIEQRFIIYLFIDFSQDESSVSETSIWREQQQEVTCGDLIKDRDFQLQIRDGH